MSTGRYAYLVHLLAWTLPILAVQTVLLLKRHGPHAARLLRAALPPALWVTVWLVAADHLAISEGLWRFGEGKHLGIRLGAVPIEEVLFFLVTNLLVALGFTLFSSIRPRATPEIQA